MSASIAIISTTRRVWMSSMRALASDQSLTIWATPSRRYWVAVALTAVWLVITSGTGQTDSHAVRYRTEGGSARVPAAFSVSGARDHLRFPCCGS